MLTRGGWVHHCSLQGHTPCWHVMNAKGLPSSCPQRGYEESPTIRCIVGISTEHFEFVIRTGTSTKGVFRPVDKPTDPLYGKRRTAGVGHVPLVPDPAMARGFREEEVDLVGFQGDVSHNRV